MSIKPLISLAAAMLIGAAPMLADDCAVQVSVAKVTQGDKVSPAVENQLQQRLMRAATAAGLSGDAGSSRFFITGRFDKGYFDVMSGTNEACLLKTTLTLYIGDAETEKTFATVAFDLKGAGRTEERAYINAMSKINARNPEFKNFVAQGTEKIIAYYDANYPRILTRARTAMQQRNYDEAIYEASTIPECCKGYDEANALMLQAYQEYTNYEGQQLLAQARAKWAASPDADGASEAMELLAQIDPASSCGAQAAALSDEITKRVKAQWDYENIKKYEDQIALRREAMQTEAKIRQQSIEAARQVSIAYAKNQPKVVYRLGWLY